MPVHTARLSYLLTQLDYGRFCVSANVAIQVRIEAILLTLYIFYLIIYKVPAPQKGIAMIHTSNEALIRLSVTKKGYGLGRTIHFDRSGEYEVDIQVPAPCLARSGYNESDFVRGRLFTVKYIRTKQGIFMAVSVTDIRSPATRIMPVIYPQATHIR